MTIILPLDLAPFSLAVLAEYIAFNIKEILLQQVLRLPPNVLLLSFLESFLAHEPNAEKDLNVY